MSEMPSAPETLLEFPCAFPIKIMGLTHDALAQTVLDVVLRHAPDFDGATMTMRASSSADQLVNGRCGSTTSKPQLDALYRELSGHPMVKVVL